MCPDEPQKRLTSLAQSLKQTPRPLYPEIPRIPAETAPKQTQDLVRNFLDTQLLSPYTHPTPKRVLINNSQYDSAKEVVAYPDDVPPGRKEPIAFRSSARTICALNLFLASGCTPFTAMDAASAAVASSSIRSLR